MKEVKRYKYSSYKISTTNVVLGYNMLNIINPAVCYTGKLLKRVSLKNSHRKSFLILHL